MVNFNSFFTILNWEVDIKFSSFWFMLGKSVIQPHFDSTWPLWYPVPNSNCGAKKGNSSFPK